MFPIRRGNLQVIIIKLIGDQAGEDGDCGLGFLSGYPSDG